MPHRWWLHQVLVPTQEAQLSNVVVAQCPTPLPVDVARLGEAAFGCGGRGRYTKGVACDGTDEGVLIAMCCPPFQGGLCIRFPFQTEVMVLVRLAHNVRFGFLCVTPR